MVEVPEGCTALLDFTGQPLCDVDATPVGGLCDSFWDCGAPEFEEYVFTDDELYRAFLKARAFQLKRDWRRETVEAAARGLFGADAFIVDERPGLVVISAGRPLTDEERSTIHLFRQVMPVAPGIQVSIVSQVEDVPFFGFGVGWGGLCESIWAQPT